MAGLPEDPRAAVPQDLSDSDVREYERRVAGELREVMIGGQGGLVEVDEIELVVSRPDTLIVFRYHHRDEYVGSEPSLVARAASRGSSATGLAVDRDDTCQLPGGRKRAEGASFRS